MEKLTEFLSDNMVAISSIVGSVSYPEEIPYLPHEVYPEFEKYLPISNGGNVVFSLVRDLFVQLQLDIKNFSTPTWNPLGKFILPGQKVLIKPNLVRHIHMQGGNINSVVTHPSIIRCILDYTALALKGEGEIVVADAPVQSADFLQLIENMGLSEVCEHVSQIWGIPVLIKDFRLSSVRIDEHHRIIEHKKHDGDSRGYISVDFGNKSLLYPLKDDCKKFMVTNYDCNEMIKHHNETINEYLIPKTVLDADVVINLPKLKTHRKVGLTAALKNLVGINGHKDWLPHYRCGALEEGGDEYLHKSYLKKIETSLSKKTDRNPASKISFLRRLGLRVVRRLIGYLAPDQYLEGSWFGNDTVWRMVLDLNRLLLYAKKNGELSSAPQRRCISIVDGVIAGDGEGPMEPNPRNCGVLIGGCNAVAVDAVGATLVGFDIKKIPLIFKAFQVDDLPITGVKPADIQIKSQNSAWQGSLSSLTKNCLHFKPPSGWQNHIELATPDDLVG